MSYSGRARRQVELTLGYGVDSFSVPRQTAVLISNVYYWSEREEIEVIPADREKGSLEGETNGTE